MSDKIFQVEQNPSIQRQLSDKITQVEQFPLIRRQLASENNSSGTNSTVQLVLSL